VSPQYAIPRSTSPQSSQASGDIFCAECLKNQHLFTSSLAQYLPDDPDDPQYAELERNYYKFRKNLEKRYPQVCAKCEPKVLGRLSKARYTAKTDHLRRLLDSSRKNRIKQHTILDRVDQLGRLLWNAGFILQFAWQGLLLYELFADPDTQGRPEWAPEPWETPAAVAKWLPNSTTLWHGAIWAALLSVWWNPRFVQTFRGFTKHVVGLSNWYAYQIVVLVIRSAFSQLAASPPVAMRTFLPALAAHWFVALCTAYVSRLASTCAKDHQLIT
jgi:hypothetical protein